MGIEAVVVAVIQPQHPQHLNLQDMHSESMILSSILYDEGPGNVKAITHTRFSDRYLAGVLWSILLQPNSSISPNKPQIDFVS